MGQPLLLVMAVVSVLLPSLQEAPAPLARLDVITLDAQSVLASARGGPLRLDLPLGTFNMELAPNPIAEGAVWGVGGTPLGVITETVTFKGAANGYPVRLAATGVGVFAVIFAPDPIVIEPEWLSDPAAALTQHRVSLWSQSPPVIQDIEPPWLDAIPAAPEEALDGGAGKTARFLIESDHAFTHRFSLAGTCNECALHVQEQVLNVAQELFDQAEIGINFTITSQWLCTVATCPYDDLPLDDQTWLETFRNRWESISGEAPHDIGHLFSGTNLGGSSGRALGLVGTSDSYALSEFTALTPPGIETLLQYAVAAHEIGHNFNGLHSQADPIPPALLPTGLAGAVYTIMDDQHPVVFQFSDGNWDPAHNNRARIIAIAASRLPT